MRKLDDKILFDTDEDFESYAINPSLTAYMDSDGSYYDWDFSSAFKQAVEEGKTFYMCDRDSLVLKRQAVTYMTISKDVKMGEYIKRKNGQELFF